jgi:hypothetical protein
MIVFGFVVLVLLGLMIGYWVTFFLTYLLPTVHTP